MTDLTQEDFQRLLEDHLHRTGQISLLKTDSNLASSTSRTKKDALHIRLRRRLLGYWGRLKLKVANTGTREFWIPDSKAPLLQISDTVNTANTELDIAVHMHVYFLDLLPQLLYHTQNIAQAFTCYVTTDCHDKAAAIQLLLDHHPFIKLSKVIVTPNRGRDIAPWIIEMGPYSDHHELFCHIHTKKSLHEPGLGNEWRLFLLTQVLGTKGSVQQILTAFNREPDLGIVIPPFFRQAVSPPFNEWDDRTRARQFFKSLGIKELPPRHPVFSAGSMCWYRPKAMSGLFRQKFSYEDFEQESNQVGGTVAHLIERSLVYIAKNSGFGFRVVIPKRKINAANKAPSSITRQH
jgi:lipopolysaccharide biosynthesis protein